MKPINRTQHIRYGHKFTVSVPLVNNIRYSVYTPNGIKTVKFEVAKRRIRWTFQGFHSGTIKITPKTRNGKHHPCRPTVLVRVKGAIPDYPAAT